MTASWSGRAGDGSLVTRRLALHGVTAEVTAPRDPFAGPFEILLGSFPGARAEATADVRVAITREEDERAWAVRTGDRAFREADGVAMAARRAEWAVVSEALRVWTRFIHVHAAVVATPRQSVLLVGRSGSGKSTTAVALAQSGMALYTDDVALIERGSLRPASMPRPIKLDDRSLRLLQATGLEVAPEHRLLDSVARAVLPGLPAIDEPGPPLTTAIFFAAERRRRPAVRLLTGAEALMRLIQQSTSERLDGSRPSDGALDVIRNVCSYELTGGDLEATREVILDLVGEPNGRVQLAINPLAAPWIVPKPV